MRHSLLVALTILSASTFAGSHHHWNSMHCGTCVTPIVDDVTSCDDLRVIFDDRDAVRAEESVPVAEARSLFVRASENGGIYVRDTNSARFSVTACKAASFGETLGRVHANVSGGNVTASGPRGEDRWLVYFIVDMPRGARGEFESTNGPVAIRGVDGTVIARAENGPLSAKETTGSINLKAENGPVAFSGSSGNVVLRTDNGPIAVNLTDNFWSRGTLDARTDNGPIALNIPRAYRSGVIVDTDGHSPVKCRAEDCRGRVKYDSGDDWGRWPNHIELGSGPTAVTLVTGNGPVAINDR